MKILCSFIIVYFMPLNAQNIDQIKKQLNDAGLSVEQAKQAAKSQGYTESQIKAEARSRGIDIDAPKNSNQIDSDISSIDLEDYEESTIESIQNPQKIDPKSIKHIKTYLKNI